MENFLKFLSFIVFSVMIQFGIVGMLIVFGKGKLPTTEKENLDFRELYFDYSTLPELQGFRARDGTELSYRYYPSQSEQILILVHGSGYHSRYLLPLADFISAKGLAQVYTPDLRGHGNSPERRGDVDYIDQLEDDLADLIKFVRSDAPDATLIVGGHSSGGGFAIRFAGGQYGQQADGYLLLSPYLKHNAPTIRPNAGGWAQPYTGRIVGLTILNKMGIHWLDHLVVIEFSMPEKARDGTETLSYSHRLNTGYAPRNYKKDLSALVQPLLVVVGNNDEAFIANQFEPLISQYTTVQVTLIPEVTHMGLITGLEVRPIVQEWLESFSK